MNFSIEKNMTSVFNSLREKLIWKKIKARDNQKLYNEWVNNGKPIPPPHSAKQEIIKGYQQKLIYDILIETGTFRGEMVYALKDHFKKIMSIELSPELYSTARKRFRKYNHIEIIHGDSGIVLNEIVPRLKKPAIFWLDGHYSGFETAKGKYETPILAELQTILSSQIDHLILIDDARLFTGKNDYPLLEDLKHFLISQKQRGEFLVEDDVIRFHLKN